MSPQRIQRKRVKGWRMPEGAVYVGRGSKWGNPYPIGSMHPSLNDPDTWIILNAEASIAMYGVHLTDRPFGRPNLISQLSELRGKDLACWCAPDKKCHADVLLELANKETP